MAAARCFVALALGDAAEAPVEAAIVALARLRLPIRWVARGARHVTLKFLGDVPRQQLPAIEAALRALPPAGALRLQLAGLGWFPPRGAPSVVWVGLDGDLEPLRALVQRVETALERVGVPRARRPFAPHLTIGRVKDPRCAGALRSALAELGTVRGEPTVVSEMTLHESELRPEGARHTALAAVALGGAPGA